MSRQRYAYPIELRGGITVLMVELSPDEWMAALKLAGVQESAVATGFDATQHALRMSLREIDGKKVTYAELEGDGLDKFLPRTRHVFALVDSWSQIHNPTEAELKAAKDSYKWIDDGGAEKLSFTLPDGRTILMEEQRAKTVKEALASSISAAKSAAAQNFARHMANGRGSIVKIDGEAVDAEALDEWGDWFSLKETTLINEAWEELHMGEGDATMGEAQPVSGS